MLRHLKVYHWHPLISIFEACFYVLFFFNGGRMGLPDSGTCKSEGPVLWMVGFWYESRSTLVPFNPPTRIPGLHKCPNPIHLGLSLFPWPPMATFKLSMFSVFKCVAWCLNLLSNFIGFPSNSLESHPKKGRVPKWVELLDFDHKISKYSCPNCHIYIYILIIVCVNLI